MCYISITINWRIDEPLASLHMPSGVYLPEWQSFSVSLKWELCFPLPIPAHVQGNILPSRATSM